MSASASTYNAPSTPLRQFLRIKRNAGAFSIDFCANDQFERGGQNNFLTWDSHAEPFDQFGFMWDYKPSIEFHAKSSSIEFKETYFQMHRGRALDEVRVSCRLSLPASDFEPVEYSEVEPSNTTLQLLLRLKEGRHIGRLDCAETKPNHLKVYEDQLLTLVQLDAAEMFYDLRYVRIRFYRYQTNRFADLGQIMRILNGEGHETPARLGEIFAQTQMNALRAEFEATQKMLAELKRDNCIVKVATSPTNPQQLILDVVSTKPADEWNLQVEYKLILTDPTLFKEEAPGPDMDGNTKWIATVYDLQPRGAYAKVDNVISDITPYAGKTVSAVCITVVEEDPLGARMNAAVRRAADCFRAENGQLSMQEQRAKKEAFLQVPLSRMFVEHASIDVDSWPAAPLKLVTDELFDRTTFPFNDDWRLEDSHENFVSKVFEGVGGISAAHGPPGTGKSTLLAKTAILVMNYATYSGKIVLCAHSNQATRVLLQRLHENAKLLEVPILNKVVYVQTPKAARRMQMSGNPLEDKYQPYALENQVMRHAQANPMMFGAYLDLHGAYTSGKELQPFEKNQYNKARARAMRDIRAGAEIFVCTMSTVNTRFFQDKFVKGTKPFDCFMVFIDEASQAPLPAYLEVVTKLNPARIILGGDHKQLQAFTRTNFAKNAWQQSPIFHAARLGDRVCTLLDVQFRMTEVVYGPTSKVHYHGLIKTPANTGAIEKQQALLQVLSRVSVDPHGDGNWHQLDSPVIIFDLKDGNQRKYGLTSCANDIEAFIVERFLQALKQTGFPMKEIMALTPYQGQYKLLEEIKDRLDSRRLALRKIDSSQGDEKAVVIFSSVRNVDIGFMRSAQRQNVGTSRQQAGLFFFGCVEVLMENPTWMAWRDAVINNGAPGCNYYAITRNCNFKFDSGIVSTASTTGPINPDVMEEEVSAPADDSKMEVDEGEITEDSFDVAWKKVMNIYADDEEDNIEIGVNLPGPETKEPLKPAFPNEEIANKYRELSEKVSSWSTKKQEAATKLLDAAAVSPVKFAVTIGECSGILDEEEMAVVNQQVEILSVSTE